MVRPDHLKLKVPRGPNLRLPSPLPETFPTPKVEMPTEDDFNYHHEPSAEEIAERIAWKQKQVFWDKIIIAFIVLTHIVAAALGAYYDGWTGFFAAPGLTFMAWFCLGCAGALFHGLEGAFRCK